MIEGDDVTPRLRMECKPLGSFFMLRWFSDNSPEGTMLLASRDQVKQCISELQGALNEGKANRHERRRLKAMRAQSR